MFVTDIGPLKKSVSAHVKMLRPYTPQPYRSHLATPTSTAKDASKLKRNVRSATAVRATTTCKITSAVQSPNYLSPQKIAKINPKCYREPLFSMQNRAVHTPEIKWRKVIRNYELQEKDRDMAKNIVSQPGLRFYALMLSLAEEKKLNIFFPATVMNDANGNLCLMETVDGVLCQRRITSQQMYCYFLEKHADLLAKIGETKSHCKEYLQELSLTTNNLVPIVIEKTSQPQKEDYSSFDERPNKFQTNVYTYKMYEQNRPRVTNGAIIQSYIFSRNMKAMVFRLCYDRLERGEQREQYKMVRFQNVNSIFKKPSSLVPTLQIGEDKVGLVQESTIINAAYLQKFIAPAQELKRVLQMKKGVRINNLYLDFVVDLFGTPWLINLKYLSAIANQQHMSAEQRYNSVASMVNCKLCLHNFRKEQMNNTISVKMFIDFIEHLRKRTKVTEFYKVNFSEGMSLNRKDYAISAVCSTCYTFIISELELIGWENKLAKICHIQPSEEIKTIKGNSIDMQQWRLMLYFDQITHFSRNSSNNLVLRYTFGKGVEGRWKCKASDKRIEIHKVKIHYIFSKEAIIQQFIRNTEVTISVVEVAGDREKVVALGSTAIISNFKFKFEMDSGQRQTSTVLLFFENRKYCELTLKIGLVWDGCYRIGDTPMSSHNGVLFAPPNYVNSNPLPRDWMEAIGHIYEDGEEHEKSLKCYKKPLRKELKRKAYFRG